MSVASFKPLPWQVDPWRDKSRVVICTGSAGGGKSRLGSEKLHGYCMKYPGAVGIGLRKAREYASKSVVFALKAAVGWPNNPYVKYLASDMMFEYKNGSRIFIAGMKDDAQRQALRSINGNGSVDFVWGEEANALYEDDHNELLARLRGTAAGWRQIFYTTNPDHPRHWIKRRLIDAGEGSVYFSRAADNFYNPEEYIDVLNSLTGVLKLRLADGQWVQAEGAVYNEFSDQHHTCDAFEIPSGWRKIRSIDFGYTNPFVCQWWAMDHDGRLFRYRELYMTKKTVAVHADVIKRVETGLSINEWNELSYEERDNAWRQKGEYIEHTVADHDAEDRATLEENGIATTAAYKAISPGIQEIRERLKIAGDGKPRLKLVRNAVVELDEELEKARKPCDTIQEMPVYSWPKDVDGKPIKEVPVDEHNHGADAMRYAVMYFAESSKPILLFSA